MDVTEKKFKKLSIQVSLTGLSFCCFNTLNNTIASYNEVHFETFPKTIKIEDLFAKAFQEYPELTHTYDDISVIHNNNLATFVPTPFFNEDILASYLQYNTKVFETDFFAFDTLDSHSMHTVYIPYVNINNFFIDHFGAFTYKHAHSILVSKLLEINTQKQEKKMFVHLNKGHFEIVVTQHQKLVFFNSFDYKTPEDLLYYILFTAEQLGMNPDYFTLEILGKIEVESNFYGIMYKYIRNVSLLDVEDLRWNNYFSVTENRAHYILFNS